MPAAPSFVFVVQIAAKNPQIPAEFAVGKVVQGIVLSQNPSPVLALFFPHSKGKQKSLNFVPVLVLFHPFHFFSLHFGIFWICRDDTYHPAGLLLPSTICEKSGIFSVKRQNAIICGIFRQNAIIAVSVLA